MSEKCQQQTSAEKVLQDALFSSLSRSPASKSKVSRASRRHSASEMNYPAYAPHMAARPMQAAKRFRRLALGRANQNVPHP
jgi:hypothetical protein